MKNVLVTGGGGFIGSNVVEHYSNREDINEVIAIDNLSRYKLLNKEVGDYDYNWRNLSKSKKVVLYEKDIRDFSFMKQVFQEKNIDIVIHTAAQTAVTSSLLNPLLDFKINVIGTFNILESIRITDSDPSIILCSTNKVYGNNVNKCEVFEDKLKYRFSKEYEYGIPETYQIDSCEHTPYGASKLCADIYFQEYGHTYGLKTGIFRMSCIYGINQFGVEDQGWVAHFIISAILGKTINIFGDGKQVRDILYISDLIDAYNAYINNSKRIGSQIFNIGGGNENNLSLLELIALLKKELKTEIKLKFNDWRPSDQKVYISDIRLANKILKWSPKISPKEGIILLIDWVKNNKDIFK